MQVTEEQQLAIDSTGNIKINAVAGSGKTATLMEYAISRPADSKILYLCFNRSIRLEAAEKFGRQGLNNITPETGHSLAKRILTAKGFKIKLKKEGNYQTHDLVKILEISAPNEEIRYILATHVLRFSDFYCNSSIEKVTALDYREITEQSAFEIVDEYYSEIENAVRSFLQKMDNGTIPMTHDFYLKKFQLLKPSLKYDYVLLDEGQDSSPAVLDIFLRQKGVKIIVGDVHQQIYSWRFAVNAMEKVKFETVSLNRSFRFNEDIALLANKVLEWKNLIGKQTAGKIIGSGISKDLKTNATLARTNAGLLMKAIAWMKETKGEKKLYFEGNISSYTYAEAGTSLYDLIHFINKKTDLIKVAAIKNISSIEKLKDYFKKTGDIQSKFLLDMVLLFGNDLPKYLQQLKDCHVKDDEKLEADMIFSTVHRSKGMEYDIVFLANDFITEQQLLEVGEKGDEKKYEEEINLLYVAITRAKNKIVLSWENTPKGLNSNEHIEILGRADIEETSEASTVKDQNITNDEKVELMPKYEVSINFPRSNIDFTIKKAVHSNHYKSISIYGQPTLKKLPLLNFKHVIGLTTIAIIVSLLFFFIRTTFDGITEKTNKAENVDTFKALELRQMKLKRGK